MLLHEVMLKGASALMRAVGKSPRHRQVCEPKVWGVQFAEGPLWLVISEAMT